MLTWNRRRQERFKSPKFKDFEICTLRAPLVSPYASLEAF